jgi:hypothetical protein
MRRSPSSRSLRLAIAALASTFPLLATTGCGEESLAAQPQAEPIAVSGSGVHYFSTAVAHSIDENAGGSVARSTDIIRLTGDLDGYVLYHPTTVIDFAAGTMVNTGTQIFSGTVAGEGPFILHDDTFRFEVQLETGETRGTVHLRQSLDAPDGSGWYECDLEIVGTGMTPEGDGLADYSGTCTRG